MDQRTPYEQLIAEKLDQVPVPDMADNIWAGIEMQLDAGSGTPGTPAKKPSAKFGGKGWYALIGVAGIVALLLWYKNRAPENAKPPKILPAPPSIETPRVASPPGRDSGTSDHPAKKKDIPLIPGVIKKDTVLFHPVPKDSTRIDSGVRQNLPPLQVKVDSSLLQKKSAPLPDVDLYASPPPPRGRKPRGVKGITEDDYKISAGKDSSRKRN